MLIFANGTAKIATSLVASIVLVLASLGLILLTYNPSIRESRDNCSVHVKKCHQPTHLYHVGAGRCIRNGNSTRELCGENMVMSPVPACPLQGQCECDYHGNQRHLVYDDDTSQCYFIDTSGPCKDGKVVKVSSNGTRLSCEPQDAATAKLALNFGVSGGIPGFLAGDCKPGSYQAFIGQCVPAISIGLDDGNMLDVDQDRLR